MRQSSSQPRLNGVLPAVTLLLAATLDWRDLRLILAQSHFALGEYTDANAQVTLLGGTAPDPNSPTFVEDLLAEIERLGRTIGS